MEAYKTEEYRGYEINIYYDNTPESPREWSNVATFVCEHRSYSLGDEYDIKSVINTLFEKYVTLQSVIKKFCEITQAKLVTRDGRSWYEFELKYEAYQRTACLYMDDYEDRIIQQMSSYFSDREKLEMVEETGEIVWLPISMYEHSGINIWLGSTSGHPDARWDCSTIGFAYVERKTAEKEGALRAGNDGLYNGYKSWQEWAYAMMEGEMETYNQYVTGQVFGYMVEGGDGYCDDSCWGFYGTDDIPYMIEEAKAAIDHALERQNKEREENILFLSQHIDQYIGETWVISRDMYRVGQDLFGQGYLEIAEIKRHRVGGYVPCKVNELDYDTLSILAKSMVQH